MPGIASLPEAHRTAWDVYLEQIWSDGPIAAILLPLTAMAASSIRWKSGKTAEQSLISRSHGIGLFDGIIKDLTFLQPDAETHCIGGAAPLYKQLLPPGPDAAHLFQEESRFQKPPAH